MLWAVSDDMQKTVTQNIIHSGSGSWLRVQQASQQPGHYSVLLLVRDQPGKHSSTRWNGLTGTKVSFLQAIAKTLCCTQLSCYSCHHKPCASNHATNMRCKASSSSLGCVDCFAHYVCGMQSRIQSVILTYMLPHRGICCHTVTYMLPHHGTRHSKTQHCTCSRRLTSAFLTHSACCERTEAVEASRISRVVGLSSSRSTKGEELINMRTSKHPKLHIS